MPDDDYSVTRKAHEIIQSLEDRVEKLELEVKLLKQHLLKSVPDNEKTPQWIVDREINRMVQEGKLKLGPR